MKVTGSVPNELHITMSALVMKCNNVKCVVGRPEKHDIKTNTLIIDPTFKLKGWDSIHSI